MEFRVNRITKALKAHDSQLYAKRESSGMVNIYRKGKCYDHFSFDDGILLASKSIPFYVFSLTDTWTVKGSPVDWGIEPIISRIKEIDLWNDETVVDRMMKSYEKDKESSQRDFKNQSESFLREFRPQFAKATNDINTANLEKTDRRRIDDGYRKP